MKEDLIKQLTEMYKPDLKVYFIYPDGRNEKVRIGKGNSGLIVMAKGSSRMGYYIDNFKFNDVTEIKPILERPISNKWYKGINRAITLLKSSGLWTDMLKDIETALSIGYDKIKEAYAITDQKFSENYEKNQEIRTQKIKELEPRLIKEGSINTGILWYMVHPFSIKKMNFGYNRAEYYNKISEAIKNKTKYHIPTLNLNYDISFEYNPEHNKAWYNEEYKNCGNGHYYLALNNEYALFYEDD